MQKESTQVVVRAALFVALIFVLTYAVKLPLPAAGYAHLGDSLLLFSALFFPLPMTFLVGALGSGMADLFGGYLVYFPATFLIKGLMAILISWGLKKYGRSLPVFSLFSLLAAAWMVLGYYLYECLLYDPLVAGADLVGNLLQGGVSLLLAALLFSALRKPLERKNFFSPED